MFKKTEERLSLLIWDMKDKEKAYLKLLEMKTTLSKMKKKKHWMVVIADYTLWKKYLEKIAIKNE